MLAGCLPFDERSVGALTKKIATAEYEMPPWISQHAAALLRAILQPNPAKRWGPHCPAFGVLEKPVLVPPRQGQERVRVLAEKPSARWPLQHARQPCPAAVPLRPRRALNAWHSPGISPDAQA